MRDSDVTNWLRWVLTAIPVLFLAFDTTVKVLAMPAAIEPTVALGYAANLVVPIGIIQLLCLVLYVVPRTAVLGAVLLTGYLGGAVATQLRAGNGAGQYLFPIVVGALLWGALWVRDSRVRALLAPTKR
jgi:DoxX-like family